MLTDIFSPETRGKIYWVFAVLGLILGAIQVGFSSAELGQPSWLTVLLAVYGFVGGAIGFTAQANTPARGRYEAES